MAARTKGLQPSTAALDAYMSRRPTVLPEDELRLLLAVADGDGVEDLDERDKREWLAKHPGGGRYKGPTRAKGEAKYQIAAGLTAAQRRMLGVKNKKTRNVVCRREMLRVEKDKFRRDLEQELYEAAIREGYVDAPPGSKHRVETVADLVDRFVEAKKGLVRPCTVESYTNSAYYIRESIGSKPLAELDDYDVMAMLADIPRLMRRPPGGRDEKGNTADGVGDATKEKVLSLLVNALDYAVKKRMVDENVARLAKEDRGFAYKGGAVAYFAAHEIAAIDDALCTAAGRDWEDGAPEYGYLSAEIVAWLLLERTGMRPSEVRGLKASDVVFGGPKGRTIVSVKRSIDAKGNENDTKTGSSRRSLPVEDDVSAVLSRWIAQLGQMAEGNGELWLVPNARMDAPMSAKTRRCRWDRFIGRLGGVAKHGMYSLRHSYATYALLRGADVRSVSSSMGHKDSVTLLRVYAGVVDIGVEGAALGNIAYIRQLAGCGTAADAATAEGGGEDQRSDARALDAHAVPQSADKCHQGGTMGWGATG